MPTIDIYPVSERDPMPEPQLLRYPVGDQHEKSLPRIWSITAPLSVYSTKQECKGQKIKYLQKDLITRDIHEKYQNSSTLRLRSQGQK